MRQRIAKHFMSMTSKYKRFWVTDHTDNSGLTVTDKYNHKTMFGACNVHEVIETQAVDDLQAKLDEDVGLLKDAKNHWGDYAPQSGNARKTFNQIDEFLKGLGEG